MTSMREYLKPFSKEKINCYLNKSINFKRFRPRVSREKPPLYNMEFVIIGKTDKSKDDIKHIIQKMGGKLGTKIHEKVAAIISTENEVMRMGNRMAEAKELGIQVVPEDFLDDAKNGAAISYIISKSLCDWGTDVSQIHLILSQNE